MRKADNLPPSCAVVTKSGNLNFPEPSGPLQACNGTALPFTTQGKLQMKDSQCTHNVTAWRVRVTIVTVEKAVSITYYEWAR